MPYDSLSGHSIPILFLKATTKKQLWIPQYTKKNGQVVGGHYTMVHFTDDHDTHKVASGQGSYSQKKAHSALQAEPGFHALDASAKAAVIMHQATQIQDKESMVARLATLRKKLLAGGKPTAGEWKWFHVAPIEMKEKIIVAVQAAGEGALLDTLYADFVSTLQAPGGAEPAPAPPDAKPDGIPDPEPSVAPVEPFVAAPDAAADSQAPDQGDQADQGDQGDAPEKPWVIGSTLATEVLDGIEAGVQSGSSEQIAAAIGKMPVNSPKKKWVKVAAYADAALAYVSDPGAPAAPAVPAAPKAKVKPISVALDASELPVMPIAVKPDVAEKANALAAAGKLAALQKLAAAQSPHAMPNTKFYVDNVVAALEAKQGTPAAPAPAPAAPAPAAVPNDDDEWIAFDQTLMGAVLDDSNKNAKSFNAKLQAIHDAVNANDAKALLALSYGTNTYGKKAAKLANEGLALLASRHQVAAGQKAGAHAAVAGKPAAVVVPPAPTSPVLMPAASMAMPVKPTGLDEIHQILANMAENALKHGYVSSIGKVMAALDSKNMLGLDTPLVNYVKAVHAIVMSSADAPPAAADKLDVAAAPAPTAPALPSSEGMPRTVAEALADATEAFAAGDIEKLQQVHAAVVGLEPFAAVEAYVSEAMQQLDQAGAAVVLPGPGVKKEDLPPTPKFASEQNKDYAEKAEELAMSGDVGAFYAFYEHAMAERGHMAKLANHLNAVKAVVDEKHGTQPADGPKEGETKAGADGLLVFKDGRWHKVVAVTHPPVDPAKVAKTIPMPKFAGKHAIKMKKTAVALHAIASTEGIKGLEKVIGPSPIDTAKLKVHAGGSHWGLYKNPRTGGSPNGDALAKYAQDLMAAMSGTASAPAAIFIKPPPAAAPAAMALGNAQPIDTWTQTGGQKGYNAGGFFTDPDGQDWYVKFPAGGAPVVQNELLACKLYELAGVSVPEIKTIRQGSKVGLASKVIHGAEENKAALLAGTPAGMLDAFAVHAWLANWDAVGNNPSKGFDNILVDGAGKAHHIDQGGALTYGGAGGKKQQFGDAVIELETMLDPGKNSNTALVFGKMSQSDIAASVKKVAMISDAMILNMVLEHGPGHLAERNALAAKLIARKHSMLAKFPQVAASLAKAAPKPPKPPIVFDPTKLGAAPDFLNWKGVNQSGPASSHEKNALNQEGVNTLLELAKTGSIQAITEHKFPFVTGNGTISHFVPALDHPSQYVKGFAQQLINEIESQMNPPKPFRWDGDSPISALHKAYPKVDLKATAAVKKLGYFVELGNPGVIDNASVGITDKIMYGKGVTRATYSPVASAIIKKIPKLQKDALKSYTSSGYQAINQSLWKGNPSGAAQSAGEALMTMGHEIKPGTVLSRKFSLSGTDLEQLKASTGKVLQEPAVMSTSINPAVWSGNIHLKMTVGPGVKGLWVGIGSEGAGQALSVHASEDEILLPPNTRILIQKVSKHGAHDSDGFGSGGYIVEVLILPSE
ncbi:ADP-ribosyltransferase [Massilia sp. P8910]|uniref:ADP-ribosyltransferase n=1 Tax=Massilia antarctica TaxID=2765360 RepID=UPI001E5C2B5A|nr:ADP-ribosyltransferase [Massilia antarctica]MCE3602753.1 ADP-ribosyltransferase [Massilia antarctica]